MQRAAPARGAGAVTVRDAETAMTPPLQKMRALCKALPGVLESPHFGERCFWVGKKLFASCGEKKGVCRVVVQLEPAHAERLVSTDPSFSWYGNQKNCVVIAGAALKNWSEVRRLVLESYRLNSPDEARPRKKSPAAKKRTRKRGT
jgi:predicted DNA-binding protein (MmcQ/YjbR family)